MKLSEFVELVPVSIAVHLKNFENLTKGPKWGAQFGVSQPKSDFWNFYILNDRKVKLSEWILFNEKIISLSGNFFARRFLCIKKFPTNINFLGFLEAKYLHQETIFN
jgi:hypothetical protein